MKDYKEMTESVLQQAKTRAARQKHQRRMVTGLIAATLCFAVLFTAIGFFVGRDLADTTQPTLSMENPTTAPATRPDTPPETTEPVQPEVTDPVVPETTEPVQPDSSEPAVPPTEMKVYYLSSTTTQVSQQFLMEGVAIPIGGEIRVRRFGGLTKEERAQAIQEEKALNEAYWKANSTDYAQVQGTVRTEYYAMVSCLVKGTISLEFADKDHVSSVELENIWENGIAGASRHYTKEVTYGEGENQITFPVGSMRYLIFWCLPMELQQKLLNDPYMSFSDISDTITITVNYSNGARQTLVIDVTVDDEGQIYMTQRFDEAVV